MKSKYSDHREDCNTCNADELCDIGMRLYKAEQVFCDLCGNHVPSGRLVCRSCAQAEGRQASAFPPRLAFRAGREAYSRLRRNHAMLGHTRECQGDCKAPGKYEGSPEPRCLTERIHELSLEGCNDEESGDVSETGLYACLILDTDPTCYTYPAFILTEDYQGFVSAEGFATTRDARNAWRDYETREEQT